MIAIGALFVVAWVIGILTVHDVGWYLHLPLLIGGAAMAYGLRVHRRAAL